MAYADARGKREEEQPNPINANPAPAPADNGGGGNGGGGDIPQWMKDLEEANAQDQRRIQSLINAGVYNENWQPPTPQGPEPAPIVEPEPEPEPEPQPEPTEPPVVEKEPEPEETTPHYTDPFTVSPEQQLDLDMANVWEPHFFEDEDTGEIKVTEANPVAPETITPTIVTPKSQPPAAPEPPVVETPVETAPDQNPIPTPPPVYNAEVANEGSTASPLLGRTNPYEEDDERRRYNTPLSRLLNLPNGTSSPLGQFTPVPRLFDPAATQRGIQNAINTPNLPGIGGEQIQDFEASQYPTIGGPLVGNRPADRELPNVVMPDTNRPADRTFPTVDQTSPLNTVPDLLDQPFTSGEPEPTAGTNNFDQWLDRMRNPFINLMTGAYTGVPMSAIRDALYMASKAGAAIENRYNKYTSLGNDMEAYVNENMEGKTFSSEEAQQEERERLENEYLERVENGTIERTVPDVVTSNEVADRVWNPEYPARFMAELDNILINAPQDKKAYDDFKNQFINSKIDGVTFNTEEEYIAALREASAEFDRLATSRQIELPQVTRTDPNEYLPYTDPHYNGEPSPALVGNRPADRDLPTTDTGTPGTTPPANPLFGTEDALTPEGQREEQLAERRLNNEIDRRVREETERRLPDYGVQYLNEHPEQLALLDPTLAEYWDRLTDGQKRYEAERLFGNPLANAYDENGNAHFDWSLANEGLLPEGYNSPGYNPDGTPNGAMQGIYDSGYYLGDDGMAVVKNQDGSLSQYDPKTGSWVPYNGTAYSFHDENGMPVMEVAPGVYRYPDGTSYDGIAYRNSRYTPDQILSLYANPQGGQDGNPTWQNMDWIESLPEKDQAGMRQLIANFVYGADPEHVGDFGIEIGDMTADEFDRLAHMFIQNMPGLEDLLKLGYFGDVWKDGDYYDGPGAEQIVKFFFKDYPGSGKKGGKPKGGSGYGYSRYRGGGGGRRYSGGGSSGGSWRTPTNLNNYRNTNGSYTPRAQGGTYRDPSSGGAGVTRSGGGGYSSGPDVARTTEPNPVKQKQNRVYNIMKNWSF